MAREPFVSDTKLEAFLKAVVNEEHKNPTFPETILTANLTTSNVRGVSNFNRMNTHQNDDGNCIVLQSVYFSSKGDGWQPTKSRSRVDIAQSEGWSGKETMTLTAPTLTRIRLGDSGQPNATAGKNYQLHEEYSKVSEISHQSNGFGLWSNHTSAEPLPYRQPCTPPMYDLVQRPVHFLGTDNTSQSLGARLNRVNKYGLDFEERILNQALLRRNVDPALKQQDGGAFIGTSSNSFDYKTSSIRNTSNKSALVAMENSIPAQEDCISISKNGNGCTNKEKVINMNQTHRDPNLSINNVNSVFELKSNSLFPKTVTGTSLYKDNTVIENVTRNKRKMTPTIPRECQCRNCRSSNCFSRLATSNRNSNIVENNFNRSTDFLQENVLVKDLPVRALCSYNNKVGVDLNKESNQKMDESLFKVAKCTEVPACLPPEEDTAATPVADNRVYINFTKPLLLNPTPYKCSFHGCLREFLQKPLLIRHQKVHAAQKLYLCPWKCCGKRFRRRDERKRHYRSHTGEKPYKCQYCGRCFSRSDHKKSHLQTCCVRVGQH